MFKGASLPGGLDVRLSRPSDRPFLSKLFRSTRQFLTLIDGDRDFIESIFDMQEAARDAGYGHQRPDAFEFIIEKTGDRIGRLMLDFGHGTVHIVDIAFLPGARGKGYGQIVLTAIQQTARSAGAPVTLLAPKDTIGLPRFYGGLGFRIRSQTQTHYEFIWVPDEGRTGA